VSLVRNQRGAAADADSSDPDATRPDHPDAEGAAPATPPLRWWRELLYAGGFYLVYSGTRNLFGSAGHGSETHAFHNAERVIDAERWLGLFHEQTVQSWFLAWPWFLRLWDIYYGTLHFIVTIVVLIMTFHRWPTDYRLWRNTLAFTTALALIGFSLFPLMPPRLLCDCLYGAGAGSQYHFVDTVDRFGGLWSFDSGTVKSISNQYAAMPSLHVAWALWCAVVLVPRLRHRWAKVLAALYPVVTLFAVTVTANHYVLDAVAGALTLAAGYALARWAQRFGPLRRTEPKASEIDRREPAGGCS
jgi:hypothetical protein